MISPEYIEGRIKELENLARQKEYKADMTKVSLHRTIAELLLNIRNQLAKLARK